MEKKVWINVNPIQVDVSTLERGLKEAGFKIIYKSVAADDTAGTIEMGSQVDAVVSSCERWNKETLEPVKKNLKFIMRYGAGIDNVDLTAATEAGIPVANVPGANAAAVAEVALLHMLNLGRKYCRCIESGKNNVWPVPITGNELDGKTVGLVGFGNIAKQLVRYLTGFKVHILAFDPYVRPDEAQFPVKAADTMEEIFSQSDIVSLHIPLNEETRGSINKSLFDLMKPGAYLVNTCRGAVIQEADLIDALNSGKIGGAGLDVMSVEPPDPNHPLLSMDNVYVSSHMGAETVESGYRSQIMMADTLKNFFNGEIPFNVRNKEVLMTD